jgi:threonine dehydrogenase-like Zn-dependent dehydrogenase
MKAIVNTGPDLLEMLERPLPSPAAGQVRIRTGACAICATDLAMIAGWDRTPFGTIPGHEWSGTVDAVGPGVDKTLLGRKCVAENVWSSGGEVGFEHPGGYAEYFLTDARNVRPLPADFDLVAAALIEPLAVCVHGLSRLGEVERPAIVFGDGPIGLLILALLVSAGAADTILVGGRETRLALAVELGARATANYHVAGAVEEAIHSLSIVNGFPCLVEASGSPTATAACIDLARPGATILVLGDYGGARADFAWNTLLHKELRLIGSNASAGAWDDAVNLAISGRIPLKKLVTHILPAERFSEGIELMRSRREDVIKVVLSWD